MRRILYIILVAGALSLCACQKEDDNGDLGGFWKLQSIERSDTLINTKSNSRFWKIQLDLLCIGYQNYGRFSYTGDSLFISMIYPTGGQLRAYGVYDEPDERFAVLHLDRNGMILQSDSAKLTFRKF